MLAMLIVSSDRIMDENRPKLVECYVVMSGAASHF